MSARRYRRKRTAYSAKSLLVLILIVLLALVRSFVDEKEEPPTALEEGIYRVERTIDGDTLLLTNQARIRLLGADTPETVKPNHPIERWGPEASEFTKDFVTDREIRLQFDRERTDHYGRFLAYVWVDDQMLNEELLRAGMAKFLPQYPYSSSMKTRFRQAEQEAKDARRGIWSE